MPCVHFCNWPPPRSASISLGASALTLTVGDQSYNTRAVMDAAGVLDNLPYTLEWKQFTAGSPVAEALNSGSLDLGLLGDAPPLFLGALGAPIKVIAVTQQNLSGVAIVVNQDSPIKTVADIRGKRVAIWKGSWSQQLLFSALDKAGVPRDAVDIRYLSALDAFHALEGGSVDVIATWEPYVTQQERRGGRVIATAQGLIPAQSFVVGNNRSLAEKRAAISDFLQRLKKPGPGASTILPIARPMPMPGPSAPAPIARSPAPGSVGRKPTWGRSARRTSPTPRRPWISSVASA